MIEVLDGRSRTVERYLRSLPEAYRQVIQVALPGARIVAAFEAGAERLEADPGGAGSASAFAKADGLAEEYGLTYCRI